MTRRNGDHSIWKLMIQTLTPAISRRTTDLDRNLSAYGAAVQSRTNTAQNALGTSTPAMSALPPKADIWPGLRNVR
jgi:hypothetical protein